MQSRTTADVFMKWKNKSASLTSSSLRRFATRSGVPGAPSPFAMLDLRLLSISMWCQASAGKAAGDEGSESCCPCRMHCQLQCRPGAALGSVSMVLNCGCGLPRRRDDVHAVGALLRLMNYHCWNKGGRATVAGIDGWMGPRN